MTYDPSTPLRWDATDEQIKERWELLLLGAGPDGHVFSDRSAARFVAREFAAACVAESRGCGSAKEPVGFAKGHAAARAVTVAVTIDAIRNFREEMVRRAANAHARASGFISSPDGGMYAMRMALSAAFDTPPEER